MHLYNIMIAIINTIFFILDKSLFQNDNDILLKGIQ